MTELRVIRVRSVETIAKPAVKALIMRAVDATQYPGTTPDLFYDEMVKGIAGNALGMFVGFADDVPLAIAICYLPVSAVAIGPQVAIAYGESRELARLIGGRVREWVKRAGYDLYYGINFLRDDEVWCRVFAHAGEIRVAGTLFEVTI